MPTGTQGNAARELPFQAVHYMRKRVNYNDAGIASGIPFAQWLPKGARILYTQVFIKTAFNAVTTNVLTVGQNSTSFNDIVNASDVDEGTIGEYFVTRGGALDLDTADALPYIKYTQTGTAASAGVADIVICFVPNNDQ